MARTCIKHEMADGTIMDGPIHEPGQKCIEWSDGTSKQADAFTDGLKKGGRTTPKPQKKNEGGYLEGPSHENGGIPAIVSDGNTPIELEGTEYIINGKATAALGTNFLDKLNATANDYHPNIQGFNNGELPTPSQFELGGRVNYQAINGKKMNIGGNIQNRKNKRPIQRKRLQDGSQTPCPAGMVMDNGACFTITGNPAATAGGYSYRKGGPIQKKQAGGQINTSPKSKARRRLKSAKMARKKIGGGVQHISKISEGHSHTIYVDENGDGRTSQGTGGHVHTISNNEIQMNCYGKCHTH